MNSQQQTQHSQVTQVQVTTDSFPLVNSISDVVNSPGRDGTEMSRVSMVSPDDLARDILPTVRPVGVKRPPKTGICKGSRKKLAPPLQQPSLQRYTQTGMNLPDYLPHQRLSETSLIQLESLSPHPSSPIPYFPPPCRGLTVSSTNSTTSPIQTTMNTLPMSPDTEPLHSSTSSLDSQQSLSSSPPPPNNLFGALITRKTPQVQAKNFFLTFPRCSVDKQTILDRLLSNARISLRAAIVCVESHKDGTPHVHVGIFLEDKLRVRDCAFWDFLGGKHGNYQVMKRPKQCVAYISKYDKSPLIHGQLPTNPNSKKSLSDTVATSIVSGSTSRQIAADFPGFFLFNRRKVEDFISYCSTEKAIQSLPGILLPVVYEGSDLGTQKVVSWLNLNLCQVRPFKAAQLFLSGPPGSLKTSLVHVLAKYLLIYPMPQEDFYDFYNDDYDVVFIDEFKGNKTATFLNLFLQGGALPLKVKGSQYIKQKNIPVIICSNYRLDECYSSTIAVSSLGVRLEQIYLEGPLDLDNIIFTPAKLIEKEKEKTDIDPDITE